MEEVGHAFVYGLLSRQDCRLFRLIRSVFSAMSSTCMVNYQSKVVPSSNLTRRIKPSPLFRRVIRGYTRKSMYVNNRWNLERTTFVMGSSTLAGGAQGKTLQACSSSPWDDSLDSYMVDVVVAEATELNVPLLAPFTIATTKLEVVRNVAIRVELRDGSVGWGEASVLPPVTAEDQLTALKQAAVACQYLKAQSRLPLKRLLEALSSICSGHDFSSVRAGMQMAVVDAVASSLQLPLWKYFGGHGASITTDITIPICRPEEAENLARIYATRGFSTIKTKVGGAVASDITLLKAIRRGHPSCSLILDANCGYDAQSAVEVLGKMHEEGLTPCLFEQPVMRDDWEGLGHVTNVARKIYGVPVAADESCRNVSDAKLIVQKGLAEVVNIKLVKMGLLEAMEIIGLVKEAGLGLMIGGMVETRVAMGFSGHIAAGLGCFSYIDLDTPLLLAEDPVRGGYEVDGAVYAFTNDYGNGCSFKVQLFGGDQI